MTIHSYSVGEHVIYSEQGLSGGIWSGEYEVNGLRNLPSCGLPQFPTLAGLVINR